MNGANLPPGVYEQVTALVNQGKKINAIKVLRDATGWSLKESKECIDALALGKTPPAFPTFDQSRNKPEHSPRQSRELPPEVFQQIVDLISARKKIEAIRIYRSATGSSLKDAKEYVETVEAGTRSQTAQQTGAAPGNNVVPTPTSGTGSTHPHATSTGGCGTSVLLLAGFVIAAIWIIC